MSDEAAYVYVYGYTYHTHEHNASLITHMHT